MIARDEILMGRDKEFPLSPELEANLAKLLVALNKFRALYGKPMTVSSGYRPGYYNEQAKGAKNSNHIICQACDFADHDGFLDAYCMHNQGLLEQCGLWLESPEHTNGWCHLDISPRKNRVFIP